MLPQMDHSVHIEPPTFSSNGPVLTTDSQMSTSTRACRKFPYNSARRRPSIYGLPLSYDDPLAALPSASSFPTITQPTPSCSGQIIASHHLFPGPPPSCYSRPCPSSMKIPKPPGEVGRPGRGGYNLRKTLGWSRQDYDNVKTIAKYDFVARYDNNWVIDDFVRCQLKYQRTVIKNRNRRREISTITDGVAIQNAACRFHKSLKYFGDLPLSGKAFAPSRQVFITVSEPSESHLRILRTVLKFPVELGGAQNTGYILSTPIRLIIILKWTNIQAWSFSGQSFGSELARIMIGITYITVQHCTFFLYQNYQKASMGLGLAAASTLAYQSKKLQFQWGQIQKPMFFESPCSSRAYVLVKDIGQLALSSLTLVAHIALIAIMMCEPSHNKALQWILSSIPALNIDMVNSPRTVLHVTFIVQVLANSDELLSGTNGEPPLDLDEVMEDVDNIMDVDKDDYKQVAEEEDKMDIDVVLVNTSHLTQIDLLVEHFSTVMCPGYWMDDM
ncbi:hypothetical protein F5879DRAFT_927268 [Lentinula edodes]|nr:hypothetical protein F5879DRAFT_927268 [Lentinula edodes]